MKPPQESKVVLMGVVKDIESTLKQDFDRFAGALSIFQSTSFFLVESNSSDSSLDVLEEFSQKFNNFRYTSLIGSNFSNLSRTEQLALARNRYLTELNSNKLYSDIDFVIVADFNNLNKLIDGDAIASSWTDEEWDVCTANQSGHYYDVWALRHKLWFPNDCWQHMSFLMEMGLRKDRAYAYAVNARMLKISQQRRFIEVDSAFGGFAIYKREVLSQGNYVGITENGQMVCEHVPLHLNLRNREKRIVLNPKMINFKYTDHSKNALIYKRILRKIKHSIV